MFTIIAFLLTLAGCVNWFMIGALQYDFVAGIFGYQGSILSRIVYIIIGLSAFFLVYKLIKGKGTLAVFSKRNKKDVAKNIAKMSHKKATSNVEVAKEDMPRYDEDYVEHEQDEERGLLNDITNDEE